MKNAVWIWIVRVVSLCVLGPIAGGLMSSLRASDGSSHATAMLSGSLTSGLVALLGVFFLALIGGFVASRAVSLREGVFNLGLVLAWGAWGAGRVGEALRSVPESGSLVMLAVEGVVVVVLAFCALTIITKARGVSGPHDDCVRLDGSAIGVMRSNVGSTGMLIGAGVVIPMVVAWLQVQNDLAGQAVWGGFVGACGAGIAGGMIVKNHSIKNERSGEPDLSLVPVILGVLLCGVVGPLVSMAMPGGSKILESIASGEAPGWMLMSSLAWAGGALIGTPVGYSWVESSVNRQQASAATA